MFSNHVKIRKYCNCHDEFEISKSLLYLRLIFRKFENICTKCNPILENSSILENELKNFIKSLNVNYVENDTSILDNHLEIDVYLPNNKFGIEFNGAYWHSDLFKDNNYHNNKTNDCESKGIQLLHIFDDEWMYKKDIIKSMIKSKLNIDIVKIFARKCRIKEVDNDTCVNFLNANHIQGSVNTLIRIGLYYEDELISVMCFEKCRKGLGNIDNNINYYNLNRFCSKLNTRVIGGASKLLSYFIKTYNPENIITYADRRYSQGKLYDSLGFEKLVINKPSYFYFNNNKKIRYHRFNYRKDALIRLGWYDENKSINEMLIERNICKIYDCGTIKYQYKLK